MMDPSTSTMHAQASFPLDDVEMMNRLLADYLHGEPAAVGLFTHVQDEMVALADTTRAQADRTQLSAALVAFQQHLNADGCAVENARRLADPTTPVVTVGQQTGLLTGPVYTVYKAISAVNVAKHLAAKLGRPVVPVFWAATDDDDRHEADHCDFWDQRHAYQTIRYPETAGDPGSLIGNLPIEEYGMQVLSQVTHLIQGLPFAAEVESVLAETLAASADMGEWCCRLLARLCSSFGMVICDPRLIEIRQLASDIIKREVASPLETTALINKRTIALRQRGYHPQLVKPADVCNFFYVDERRHRVTYQNERFSIEGNTYTAEELTSMIECQPERFIPNAVLRPVVQEYLFGSSAFITGPNEFCYWAELQPVFTALRVAMPVVVPRAGATLIPPAAARFLHRWEISPLDLFQNANSVRYALLSKTQPARTRHEFVQSRDTIEHLIANLVDAVSGVESTLAQSALATHQRMVNEIDRLERKTLKAVERQSAVLMERFATSSETLFPQSGLQERRLNIWSIIAYYGLNTFSRLFDLLDTQEGRHVFVEL